MTDDNTTRTSTPDMGDAPPAGASQTDDAFAWTEPESGKAGDPATGARAREWLTQLQTMIENLATQAAPVVREVGAKAAELAALAGEKAGPAAQKAADITEQAGHKLAVKSRDLAAELRRDAAAGRAEAGVETNLETASDVAESTSTTGTSSEEHTPSGVA